MEYRRLGRTGIRVAPVGLGSMTFGKETDAETAARMVARYLDAGGNVVDSADGYNGGLAEEYLGRALEGRRDKVVVSTKVRFATGPDTNDRGASRRHILDSVHQSLRRLRTDWIDVYQLHCWDPSTELEETLSTLDALVTAGKVRYVGASNYAAWQVATALGLSALHGWEPFTVLQPQYSLVCRGFERELLPLCERTGLGVLTWSPLGGGVLTGKYAPGTDLPEGTRAADSAKRGSPTMAARMTPRSFEISDLVAKVATETGRTPSQVAIAWAIRQPCVSSVLLGARTLDQLEDTLGALGEPLDDDAVARLDDASALPPEYPSDFLAYSSTV
ncbi:MAG TPA: aldo/keto reductase [Frankiaceae bacterium]|jgi:aryl-alcohol dehydrogenase-like predicted oxidoreductase|nr:aldo/keto reductase [Frankiaceae bacterium]